MGKGKGKGKGKGRKRGRKRNAEAAGLKEVEAAWSKEADPDAEAAGSKEADPDAEAAGSKEAGPDADVDEAAWTKMVLAADAELALKLGIKEDETDPDNEAFLADPDAYYAREFRATWEHYRSRRYGAFEDTTSIPPMLYTDEPVPPADARFCDTIEIYSVIVRERNERLQWPLHVFGMVALRDSLDHNRNIIFNRTRDNCQILADEAPYLELTGPSRGVVSMDDVDFEAVLNVKGATESEDRELSLLAESFNNRGVYSGTCLIKNKHPSKLSTVEFTFGLVSRAVEATISVQVKDGSWPDDWHGVFTASIDSIKSHQIVLLDSGNGKVPVTDDGMITLSRRVTSVENAGKLTVAVYARQHGYKKMRASAKKSFTPLKAGRSSKELKVGFCKMEVTVAWSLFPIFR